MIHIFILIKGELQSSFAYILFYEKKENLSDRKIENFELKK